MTKYFTADFHISHFNIMEYCDRPFTTIEEHDAVITENMYSVLKEGDELYLLGDISFQREKVREFLDGVRERGAKCYVVWGNHDWKCKGVISECAESMHKNLVEVIDGVNVVMSHRRIYDKSEYAEGSYFLHGHAHGKAEWSGCELDVGVDTNNFKPYSWVEIRQIMDDRNGVL